MKAFAGLVLIGAGLAVVALLIAIASHATIAPWVTIAIACLVSVALGIFIGVLSD